MWKMIKYVGLITFCWILLAATRISGQLLERYVGCFVENGNNQKTETVLMGHTNLTIEICIQKCYNETNQTKSEMTFAALTNGKRCTCRNNSGQQLPDLNCNVKCSGDPMQNCGGSSNDKFYSLYTVCPVGYFGPQCDQLCHCKRRSPCDRETGNCPDGCDDQWNGTSCNISDIQKQYIGCYGDGPYDTANNAMDVKNPGGKTGSSASNTNSNEFCIDVCSINNYTYAGMQYGYDCNCGEKYDRYGNKTHNGEGVNCNDPDRKCPAKPNQKCGGGYANSVYYVCPVGLYGRNCSSRCHCNGNPCRFNGTCLTSTLNSCKAGWTGPACNARDCGINNGDCKFDETCERTDVGFGNASVCRCRYGSYRDNNTCIPEFSSLYYVGCYKGSTTQYDAADLRNEDILSIEFCILSCRQLNATYSIITGGDTCLCGNDYGRISPDSDCQVPCIGNRLQYCGGKNASNEMSTYVVYTTNSFLREYIGCYQDRNYPAAMEKKFSWWNRKNNTIDSCIRHCGSNNYTYAGLQYRYDCNCGYSYNKYGSLPEARCSMTCEGNVSQICGGGFANSVYAVNDIFWCSNDSGCKENEACDVIDLNYVNVSRCRCRKGFNRISTWELCTDVDECQSGASTCDPESENCVNNIGSYTCRCKDGFFNNSVKCEDTDECRNNTHNCNIETELCNNTPGSYTCQCKPGYENSTFGNCTDVNECQPDMPVPSCDVVSENCFNSIGSYICECKDGFVNTSDKCEGRLGRPARVSKLCMAF